MMTGTQNTQDKGIPDGTQTHRHREGRWHGLHDDVKIEGIRL